MERKLIVAVVHPFLPDKIVVALEDIKKFPGIISHITVQTERGDFATHKTHF